MICVSFSKRIETPEKGQLLELKLTVPQPLFSNSAKLAICVPICYVQSSKSLLSRIAWPQVTKEIVNFWQESHTHLWWLNRALEGKSTSEVLDRRIQCNS